MLAPFRRFVHASSCSRLTASLIHAASESPTAPGVGSQRGSELSSLLNSVAVGHDYLKSKPDEPANIPFKNQTFVRPIDMHSNFRGVYFTSRKRGNVGPGREARYSDIFLQLGIDPRLEADNMHLLSDFVSLLGRVQPRTTTLLTQRSQRLLGKAIKRAKMMGVIPTFSNANVYDMMRDANQTTKSRAPRGARRQTS